jgi:protein BCP1
MLLAPSPSPALQNRPALIFSLRTLNLPLPLIPPLYKMTLEELDVDFTHWLLWGRGYRLEGTEEDMGLQMDSQKSNKRFVDIKAGSFPYHPEEEFLDKVSSHLSS